MSAVGSGRGAAPLHLHPQNICQSTCFRCHQGHHMYVTSPQHTAICQAGADCMFPGWREEPGASTHVPVGDRLCLWLLLSCLVLNQRRSLLLCMPGLSTAALRAQSHPSALISRPVQGFCVLTSSISFLPVRLCLSMPVLSLQGLQGAGLQALPACARLPGVGPKGHFQARCAEARPPGAARHGDHLAWQLCAAL